MKSDIRIGIALALMLCSVGTTTPTEYEVALMGGGHRFREGSDLRDQFVLRGTLGRHLGNRHGVEASLNVAISSPVTRRAPGGGAEARAEALVYGIDYSFYLRPHIYEHKDRRLVPYVSGGIGGFVPSGDNVHGGQRFAVNAGAGAKYIIGKRLAFRAAFRIYSTNAHRDVVGTHRIRMDSLMTGVSLKF